MPSGFLGGGVGPMAIKRRASSAVWYRAGGAPVPQAAHRAIGVASLAESYVNLANPGVYDAAPQVAPGLAAGGWTFDGLSQYLFSCTPQNNSNWGIIVRIVNSAHEARPVTIAGLQQIEEENPMFMISDRYYANQFYCKNGTYGAYGPAVATNAVLAMVGLSTYINGIQVGSIGVTDGSPAFSIPLAIGAINATGTIGDFFKGTIAAVAIYDSSANHAVWVPAVSSAMAALT